MNLNSKEVQRRSQCYTFKSIIGLNQDGHSREVSKCLLPLLNNESRPTLGPQKRKALGRKAVVRQSAISTDPSTLVHEIRKLEMRQRQLGEEANNDPSISAKLKAHQFDMLKFLRESIYWQRSGGRDHVIPMHHPNAFRFLREQVNASILIVTDFGRYPKIMSNLSKDVVAPYVHVVDSFTNDDSPDPYESHSTLLFFRGRTVRKDERIVRAKLAKILVGIDDVHYERSYATGESIKMSSEGMRLSKFCLHPAGDTPSSCRLFDAIVSHCVPVIVSDQIELPYEDELDYTQFSLFFSVKEALVPGNMVARLRKFPKERWLEMWRRLKNISRHFEFQYPPKKEDAVNMIWRQVKHKVPAAKLAVHRSRRLKVPDWWRRRR